MRCPVKLGSCCFVSKYEPAQLVSVNVTCSSMWLQLAKAAAAFSLGLFEVHYLLSPGCHVQRLSESACSPSGPDQGAFTVRLLAPKLNRGQLCLLTFLQTSRAMISKSTTGRPADPSCAVTALLPVAIPPEAKARPFQINYSDRVLQKKRSVPTCQADYPHAGK